MRRPVSVISSIGLAAGLLVASAGGPTAAHPGDDPARQLVGRSFALPGTATTPASRRAGAAEQLVSATATFSPANPAELANVAGYQTFRQVASAGSFEGYSNFGLGVRARLPFRVFALDGPGNGSRLVIDVAHFW